MMARTPYEYVLHVPTGYNKSINDKCPNYLLVIIVQQVAQSREIHYSLISFLTTVQHDVAAAWAKPDQLHAIEADHVLHVHQHNRQWVELIGQPEISKAHSVERSGDHTELCETRRRRIVNNSEQLNKDRINDIGNITPEVNK